MITAVDTSVLLDVLTNDPTFAEPSAHALRTARRQGALLVCDCVVAEVLPSLGDSQRMRAMMGDLAISYSPMSIEAAIHAGEMLARYLERGGTAKRLLPDFLVGAHAQESADRLLARDRGYLRDYFSELHVWYPARPSDSKPVE